MGLLSRDQVLGADDLPFEDVEVPEWGGTVRIRTMTGTERDHFEEEMFLTRGGERVRNMTNLRARLVGLTAVNDAGERLFTLEDMAALGKKSAAALDRCFWVATRLNGLGEEEVEALGKA